VTPSAPSATDRGPSYFNGAELDLAEIYAWGWADLQRINARMREIATDVAPGAASLVEVAARLDADDDRAVDGADALLDRLRGLTDGAVAMLDGVHFDIDERCASATPGWPPRVRRRRRTTSRPART
jgi:uncharacterized protein (DUF885 family)